MISPIAQTGPTCGIYALINGLCTVNDIKLNKSHVDEIVYDLLSKHMIYNNQSGYTFIGEFFDIKAFESFIKENIESLVKRSGCNRTKEYDVYTEKINELNKESLQQKLHNKDIFILYNIYYRYENHNTINHWIAICYYENFKFICSNSGDGSLEEYSFDELIDKNDCLKCKRFYWESYKRRERLYFKQHERKINKLISRQLAKKQQFLGKGILKAKVKHQAGEMIVISKKSLSY